MKLLSFFLIFIFLFGSQVLGWFFVYLRCEYKFLWCKGKCSKCYNWKCKFFNTDIPEEYFRCKKGDS